MILSNSYSVKLVNPVKKILFLYTAFNETFVFLALITERKDGIVHVDKQGKVLFQHFFEIPVQAIAMMSEKQVVIAETRRNRLSVLCLETYTFSYYPHHFMSQESDQSNLLAFCETKYLCLEEKGRYNDPRYKLTYFQYPLKLEDKKTRVLAQYEAKEGDWSYEHITQRGNNVSMVCWYKPRHDDAFQFKVYELVNGKGQYINYRINNSIAADAFTPKMQFVVLNAWQLKTQQFLFVCITAKNEAKKTGGTVINSNYVIDFSSKSIRQAQFTFGPYQDYLIDCYSLGSHSMLRTFKFEDGKPLKSPTYYLDNQIEQVVAQETWECSYHYKYQFPGYGSGLICEGFYEDLDISNFKVNLRRVVNKREAYWFLLSEMGQMDEELLIITMHLLDAL